MYLNELINLPFIISRLLGTAPFRIEDEKFKVSLGWIIYSNVIFLSFFSINIYLCKIIFDENPKINLFIYMSLIQFVVFLITTFVAHLTVLFYCREICYGW